MRLLILGGTSFIGPAVVSRLLELGHEVTVFHRGEHERDAVPDVPPIHGDRADLARHADVLRIARPDVVIDMRAMFERDAASAVDTFRGVAGRLVAISSADVYRAYGRLHGSEPGPLEPMPI